MGKENEITSTEKLLDVIRGNEKEIADGLSVGHESSYSTPMKGTSLRQSTIGVDIGKTNIKLVKMDKRRRVKDFAVVPIKTNAPRDSEQFASFIKSVLQRFVGRDNNYSIWAAVSAAQAELAYIKVPKVPASQLANVVLLSFRKDYPFTEQERIFDFSVIDETTEGGAKKIEVMAYSVPRETVERTRRLFEQCGYNVAGLTVYPYALQNLFRSSWVTAREETYCCLLLGMNWSRIDIFRNGNLMMSRGIKTGINSMIRSVAELAGEDAPPPDDFVFDDGAPETEAPEEVPENLELAGKLFFKMSDVRIKDDQPLLETVFSKNDLREVIHPALNRLIRQVERTIEHYALHIGGSFVSALYFQSEVAVPDDVPNGLAGYMSIPLTILDPFEHDPSLLGPSASGQQPVNASIENSAFNAAFGLALSDKDTPNIIKPYTVKERKAKALKADMVIGVAAAVIMAVLISFYMWQSLMLNVKKAQIKDLEIKVSEFQPLVDQNVLLGLTRKIQQNKKIEAGIATRYKSLAVMNDISEKTPARIRLTRMDMDLGTRPASADDKGKTTEQMTPQGAGLNKTVVLEGVVFGESATLEPALAEYLLQLESSPLMERPRVQNSEYENFEGRRGLVFKVEVDLI